MALNALTGISSILVPVDGSPASHRALGVAADIAKRTKAHIHLLHVIEVPRTIALDATLEGELQRAEEILDEAEPVAEGYGVAVAGELVQARQAGHATEGAAGEGGAGGVASWVPVRSARRLTSDCFSGEKCRARAPSTQRSRVRCSAPRRSGTRRSASRRATAWRWPGSWCRRGRRGTRSWMRPWSVAWMSSYWVSGMTGRTGDSSSGARRSM